MEERLIIIFLKLVAEVRDVKNPSPNIAGMVLIPKINITKAPYKALAVLAAVIAKKYTNPHGKRPFNIPRIKKLKFDLEFRTLLKALLYKDEDEKECSIIVKNFILPISDNPANTITIPANISKTPFALLLKVTTPPKAPKIDPSMVYVKTLPNE